MKIFPLFFTIALTAAAGLASADDGAITNKSMSRTIKVPTFDQEIVNSAVSEAEHAFTDMMGFYVPAQAASGLVGPIDYCDIDNQPDSGEPCDEGQAVETLEVAKPLVNVFIYGPAFGVEGTAFAHRFFDTYAAVSLDDGETWKKTNLSESADLSSFNLEEDHVPSSGKPKDPLPQDHTVLLGDDDRGPGSSPGRGRGRNDEDSGDEDSGDEDSGDEDEGAYHAPGYDYPYSNGCTECHGVSLTGTPHASSCYSCHDKVWKETDPNLVGPVITEAEWKLLKGKKGRKKGKAKLEVEGYNAEPRAEVTIINGVTGHEVGITDAQRDGEFKFTEKYTNELPPCTVAAVSDDLTSPVVTVTDDEGEPLEDCEGKPLNITDYPGGSYNVFHATAGNKTLVAWPSRYCQKGQPAYAMTTDNQEDEDQLLRLTTLVNFLQNGDEANLGVAGLTDFNMEDDLYLLDAFGVAGKQGSVDFADEGYPQAGVVPFGCVWTARGVLLPGDDPRTEEAEESHMVWTKAERLTSGRRDPNRIEVKAVKGAGFVMTWQEDPDGLRPGQGLGPGEGWSGAVAHSQTDVWYSFINWEYFDIVEDVADPTVPVNILDHPLAADPTDPDAESSGRPQVFVPMAVPMRLTNNAKCNPPGTITAGGGTEDLYCVTDTDELTFDASAYGLKDQCADTVTILTGNENSTGGVTESEICVADTDGDGTADLPNRANTAATRPRLSLQGYDQDVTPEGSTEQVTDKSAWVIVAAEESKGLGKYFFRPDGLNDSSFDDYADPCTEEESETDPTCSEEIGKNQWYFSFDMGTPDTSAGIGEPNSLVENLVSQGNMLNQAEVYWETGELLGLMSTADMEDYDDGEGTDYNFDIVNTEIARRASILVQSIAKADASANGLTAISSWKQGPMRQGGPADTMLRRFVQPEDYVEGIETNPYAFENMECDEFLIEPDANPYYPGGVCADPAINLSGVVPDTCWDDGEGSSVECPTVDFTSSTYGIGTMNPILRGITQGEGDQTRVLTWHQCPSDGVQTVGDITAVTCADDDRTDDFVNLRDQSWYNPLDISKGHRGFLDGDFVQFLYAWSPTWRLNAKGHDRYELYVRRSFDGGITWVTTPSGFTASDGLSYSGDGTVTCESYRPAPEEGGSGGDRVEPKVCYSFAAGAAEHARNITQHRSMKITTLDPRYAPTKATITDGCTDGLFVDPTVIQDENGVAIFTCDDLSEELDSDLRDPSRYFMVYETGDNTTVEVGEAEPLNLYYARAESFGDDYVVWTETDTDSADLEPCYPNTAYDVLNVAGTVLEGSGFCNEFDRMNTRGDTHSSEANMEGNPDGSKLYAVWAQWVFDETGEEVSESSAQARRIWWIDDYVSDTEAYTLPGTSQSGDPDPVQ